MADERDDEIAALKARLEAIEGQKAAPPPPPPPPVQKSSGFLGGFFGCFGVLAAIVLCVVLFFFWAGFSTLNKERAISSGRVTDGSAFTGHCVAGLQNMARADADWIGAQSGLGEPTVYRSAPPQEVTCMGILRSGELRPYRIRIRCGNAMEPSCTGLSD